MNGTNWLLIRMVVWTAISFVGCLCSSFSLEIHNGWYKVLTCCEAMALFFYRHGYTMMLFTTTWSFLSDPYWWAAFVTSSELLIHHHCPPGEHWREAWNARDRVLCGRCARRQHKGRDLLLRGGRDQVQPHVSGRGIWAASGSVTYISAWLIRVLIGTDVWIGMRIRSFKDPIGQLHLLKTGSFPHCDLSLGRITSMLD